MNLKHYLFAAAFITASATASAETFAVWPAAGEGQTQIPVEFNGWYNFETQEVTDGDVTAIKCWPANNTLTDASSGWLTTEAQNFDFSQLAPLDLVFDARIEGSGTWNVRLTASGLCPDQDATIAIPADGEYHSVRFRVADAFPQVAEQWASGAANGKSVFTFALVGTSLSSDAAIYFTDCRYETAKAMPALAPEVKDITATSATLVFNASFPEGYTDTALAVNGQPVEGTEMQLTGLEGNTEYTYTVKASGELNGETLSTEKTVSFRTGRDRLYTWYGVTDIDGFSADYSITYNLDNTITVAAELTSEKALNPNDCNFHIFIGGDEWIKLHDDGTGLYAGTSVSMFEYGKSITWEWYMPVEGGVYQQQNTYVVGSENDAPLKIRVKAEAQNVTAASAEIAYTVTAPEGADYKVYYKAAEGEAVEAAASPIMLSGLTESTEYSYEVYAVLTPAEGEPVESAHAAVSFKTPSATAREHIYADLFSTEVKNAYLIGEEESMRRSFFVTIPWKVVYAIDGTAVYSADLSSIENVVGLNPQIYWNGFRQLKKNDATGLYEYSFGAQELEAATAISHYFAYNGGTVDVRTPYTAWGMEQEAPGLGAPADLSLSVSKEYVRVNEPVILTAVAKDEAGHYLGADDITFSVTETDYATVAANILTVTQYKGTYHVTAACGDLEASAEIHAIASQESDNIAQNLVGVADPFTGDIRNVTDANLESQIEWSCAETQEHYYILDLVSPESNVTEGYYIEAVDVLFEGAYATAFTVTLSSAAPAELTPAAYAAPRAAGTDVVFTNEKNDTRHVFTQDPAATHRYVTLRTTKALNTDWGIKLRDLKVYGTATPPSSLSGVENIAVSDDTDAPAEYFDLSGRRIAAPDRGLYIVRRGTTVTKQLK